MKTERKSFEADNLTGRNHEGQTANTPVRRLTSSSIIGDSVENPEGEDLGKIDELMINLETGTIEYVVLEFGAFLGMGGKLFAIPFKELKLDPVREIFILNRDKDYLKNAPGFDKDHWPETNDPDNYSDGYYNNVGTYWGYGALSGQAASTPRANYY